MQVGPTVISKITYLKSRLQFMYLFVKVSNLAVSTGASVFIVHTEQPKSLMQHMYQLQTCSDYSAIQNCLQA